MLNSKRKESESYVDYKTRMVKEEVDMKTRLVPVVLWSKKVNTPDGVKGVSYIKSRDGKLEEINVNN